MTWNQLFLQDAASPVMEELMFFHDFSITSLVFIVTAVAMPIMTMFSTKFFHMGMMQGLALEYIWTLLPGVLLVQLSFPSMLLLYGLEASSEFALTLKVIGHQWYWSYEYSDFEEFKLEFDSYMVPTNDLEKGMFRTLDVDNRPVVPFNTPVRVLVSSADVIHSWTVPVLGVKVDATPGRLNQTKFVSYRAGVFYGQCSEICGANHSFMPIAIEVTNSQDFMDWVVASSE